MKKIIKAGATSQTIDIFIQDSASTTGAGKTGLAYNTASLTAYYRKGATGSATAITLATQTVGGAYSSGGFVEIDATNMPGLYRLDLPNAVVDTAGSVSLMLKGASGMAPLPIELQVIAADLDDAAALGLSRLDATIGSRLASASYTAPLDAAGTRSAVGLASANLDTQIGLLATASALSTVAGYLDTEVAAILAAVDTEVGAIKAKTDNLPAAPAATGDAMTLTSAYDIAKGTVAITESYRADGAAPTLAQALCELLAHQGEASITGTTKTLKKFDGSTTAATFTLDDATTPTSITRAT